MIGKLQFSEASVGALKCSLRIAYYQLAQPCRHAELDSASNQRMAEVEELANFFNIKLNKDHMTNVSNWLDPETSSGWRGAARDFCFVFKFYFIKL